MLGAAPGASRTVLAWQADEIESPPETFSAFQQRVRDARQAMLDSGAERIRVWTGTFNLGASPPPDDLSLWIPPPNVAARRVLPDGGLGAPHTNGGAGAGARSDYLLLLESDMLLRRPIDCAELGVRPGVALNPATPAEAARP